MAGIEDSRQTPSVIINNYPPQNTPQSTQSKPVKTTHAKSFSFPSVNGDWVVAILSIALLVIFFEPNVFRVVKSSSFGQFFSDSTLVVKTAATATNTKKDKAVSQKLVFPMAGWTAKKAESRISSKSGECRPLAECKRSGGRIGVCYGKKCTRPHPGTDWAILGTVVSSLDGQVVELKTKHPIGGIIGIRSTYKGNDYLFRYIHLDKKPLRRFKTKKGDPPKYVKAGERLSEIGTVFVGSSGAHLHLEIYKIINGNAVRMDNPQDFFK